MTNSDSIRWFKHISKEDVPLVGGKGANLGEMTSFDMPVPSGFVVTAQAYQSFLAINKLEPKIREILKSLDVNNPLALEDASKQTKKLITYSSIPEELGLEIIRNYLDLTKKQTKLVAVRSSATSEDSKEASFAGQNTTFLNVSGEANLVSAVRDCWASLFEARSIFYRVQNHFDHFKSYIAVVVQLMIPSDVSGIIFSIDPVTNNRERIVIEAVYGLGEYIVQGIVTPDHYEVNKSDFVIVEKNIVPQKVMLTRDNNGTNKQQKVSKPESQKIPDGLIREIARLSVELEKHYYFPQDSEFAVFKNKVYLIQTRPITTTGRANRITSKINSKQRVILEGSPASPGIKSGQVQILRNSREINKINSGEVLVAEQTNPDFVPAMKKAAAIVTDRGGRTSHAAIVSRELGIPCVVGTGNATKLLKNGQMITVDGSGGKVYSGEATKIDQPKAEITNTLSTKTKVYVNLAEPEKAKEIAAKNCDGVGLLRAEFMLAGIGIHPKKIIADHKEKSYTKTLADQLTIFAEAFYPRPVVYRTTDFRTNEFRGLKGGDKYEPHEENPMIGFRGAFRYITEPHVFKMEIEAIKIVREKFNNLHVMIPFCRTVDELKKVKALLSKFGLERSKNFYLWMMCEIPANVILLDKFIEVGLDGISVGSNDLTMLTLGVDRDNENVASEYDERNPAVLHSLYKIIKICNDYGVTCSICGQAPSDYPDLTEKLVKWGITSVSVAPDTLAHTRQVVYEAEKKLK